MIMQISITLNHLYFFSSFGEAKNNRIFTKNNVLIHDRIYFLVLYKSHKF